MEITLRTDFILLLYQFNVTLLDDPDFCYDLDTSHPLGGQTPIQKDALFKMSMVVNAITVQKQQNNGTIFFLGDSRGNVVKVGSFREDGIFIGYALLGRGQMFLKGKCWLLNLK